MAKNNIAESLKRIENRFDGIDDKFEKIDKRFDGLEKKFDVFDTRLNMLNGEVKELNRQFVGFRSETLDRFDHVFNKLDFHNDEYHAMTAGMKRIEDEHRIIDHATILKEINALKASKN